MILLLGRLVKFFGSIEKLSRRGFSSKFIEFLILNGAKNRNQFKNKEFMDNLFKGLEENGFKVRNIQFVEEDGYYEFIVTETQNGGQSFSVNWDFFSSPELRRIMGTSDDFRSLKSEGFRIREDGEKEKIKDPKELLNDLMEKAKKGLSIQRYKGLGEMNPDQLWNTTMDPQKRTLVQVMVADAVEADQIFTILMGDKVEQRREFIENNALEVTDLDI